MMKFSYIAILLPKMNNVKAKSQYCIVKSLLCVNERKMELSGLKSRLSAISGKGSWSSNRILRAGAKRKRDAEEQERNGERERAESGAHSPLKPNNCLIFTCVSYAEARLSYMLDVCPSVRPSVRPSVSPSVHLSVRLSHAGIVSKRLNILSCFLHHTIAHSF